MIIWIAVAIASLAIWKIIILPYIRLLRFERQGIKVSFFPVIGKYFYCLLDLISNKDFYFEDKVIASTGAKVEAYAYNLGSRVCLHISKPEMIKELQEKENLFQKDSEILEYLFTLIGKGIVKQTGEKWSSHRKIISNSLHFDRLRSMVPVIQQIARKNFEKIGCQNIPEEIEIFDVFQNITSGVIMKLFFNENIEELLINGKSIEKELGDIVNEVGSELIGFWNITFGSGFLKKGYLPKHNALNKRIEKFKKFCQSIVEARIAMKQKRDYISRNDLLDAFIDSGTYHEDEIVDELVTFFLAGFETSSHALETIVYLLDTHKEWKKKILRKSGSDIILDDISYEDISQLDDLAIFVKESFRFIPPVTGTVHRVSDEDIVIGGIKIPKLTKVRADMIYNHFNPEYYDDPLTFNPNRWRNTNCPKNPYGFMPFGYGVRKCVGSTLAILETKVILHEFVKAFDFVIADNYQTKFSQTTFYGLSERLRLKIKRKTN